ncbi:hypothetical protein K1719_016443 [Acacia pycnantha]|nr:hypothetical protein K1719_016443 [Acacia pycnantha]
MFHQEPCTTSRKELVPVLHTIYLVGFEFHKPHTIFSEFPSLPQKIILLVASSALSAVIVGNFVIIICLGVIS